MLKVWITDREWELPASNVSEMWDWYHQHPGKDTLKIMEASAPLHELSQKLVGQPVTLHTMDELGYISSCLEEFSDEELLRFQMALGNQSVVTIPDMVTASGNLERYLSLPHMSRSEVGKFLVEKGVKSFPQEVVPYLNYEQIGAEFEESSSLLRTVNGVLLHDGKPDAWRYNGRNLPHMPGNAIFRVTLKTEQGDCRQHSLPTEDIAALENTHILSVKSNPQLREVLPEIGGATVLNQLAGALKRMDRSEYDTFLAAMEVERPDDMAGAIGIAGNLRQYKLLPSHIDYPEAYAHYVLSSAGNEFYIDDEIDDFIDYERYGEYKMMEDGVRSTEQGWLIRKGNPFPLESEQTIEPTMGGM